MMTTPICDFVSGYIKKNPLRLHMPGHKGKDFLGFEKYDITEIEGADSLFEASGIIKESEENASKLFGCDTCYSTEGSSLCIRAMLYLSLLFAGEKGQKHRILASRNVHKTFISAAALLDIDVVWLTGEGEHSYLSCPISADYLEKCICETNPSAVYITSPDYLGNMADIPALSKVCKKHNVLLLVDNAHGAYLRFLSSSLHPIDLGADICCDSAHKTLPVLTGGAYLHISDSVSESLSPYVKNAMSLFSSTSPSYLILQSLDYANKYLCEEYREQLKNFIPLVQNLKCTLTNHGYKLISQEPLKITISPKEYGYTGTDFSAILLKHNIVCEFCDPDNIVFMLSTQTTEQELRELQTVLLSIPRLPAITQAPPKAHFPKQVMSIREASLSPMETISVKDAKGRVLAAATVGCPPAVPIVVCAELINEDSVNAFQYYNIDTCMVLK